MLDLTAVIATVFHPVTLEPLIAQLRDEGAHVIVVEGRRTNAAWNLGLASAQTRYAAILNDDIELSAGAAAAFMKHHAAGFSLVTASMARLGQPEDRPFTLTETPSRVLGEPWHKGHAFSVDRSLEIPPIPDDMEIYFGDDWLYWHHVKEGRCCVAADILVKTGWDLGGEEMSGFTSHHPMLEGFLGEPLNDITRRDHVAARRYFYFRRDFRRPDEKVYPNGHLFPEACPCTAGIKES